MTTPTARGLIRKTSPATSNKVTETMGANPQVSQNNYDYEIFLEGIRPSRQQL